MWAGELLVSTWSTWLHSLCPHEEEIRTTYMHCFSVYKCYTSRHWHNSERWIPNTRLMQVGLCVTHSTFTCIQSDKRFSSRDGKKMKRSNVTYNQYDKQLFLDQCLPRKAALIGCCNVFGFHFKRASNACPAKIGWARIGWVLPTRSSTRYVLQRDYTSMRSCEYSITMSLISTPTGWAYNTCSSNVCTRIM